MAMKFKVYDYLPDEAKNIRKEVFTDEQGFENEFDDIDNMATHMVMYNENDEPIATGRVFEGEAKTEFILGRLAVILPYRGKNIGTSMIREAEKLVLKKGGTSISLHAQCRAKEFYEKAGYVEFGKIEDDEGYPHIWMKKEIRYI